METKFKLGDEIHVDFIGKIVEISLNSKGEIEYGIDTKDFSTFARRIKESMITKLPEPKDFA